MSGAELRPQSRGRTKAPEGSGDELDAVVSAFPCLTGLLSSEYRLALDADPAPRPFSLVPYLDPYESCLMCLMRLLDVLGERG